MKKSVKCLVSFAACAFAAPAFATPTMSQTSDGKYEISVPADEEYALTADDVTAIGSHDLVKGGAGTLVAGAVMKDFAQSIYITNGVYRLAEQGGLGSLSTLTHTYVSGSGTLVNLVGETLGWDATSSCGKEHVHIEGTGYRGMGAISNAVYTTCFSQGLTLTGDATISSSKEIHLRQYDVDMGGHDLRVEAPNCPFNIVSLKLSNPGNIDANAFLKLDGLSGTISGKTVLVREGERLSVRGADSGVLKDSLTMEADSAFWQTEWSGVVSEPGPSGVTTANSWAGPVELQGRTFAEMVRVSNGTLRGLTLSGYVFGAGGITNRTSASSGGGTGAKVGGWLQLSCPTNAFRGGVAMVSDPTIAEPSGGLAVLADGAVPTDGGPVVIGNSSLWLANDGFSPIALPDVTVIGSGVVTGQVVSSLAGDGWTMATNCATLKSLTKTGDGVLDLKSAVRVEGRTEIGGGTLRLGTGFDPNAGLDVWYGTNFCGYAGGKNAVNDATIKTKAVYRGTCPEGVAAAYHKWPRPGVATDTYQPSQQQTYFYEGYIRVPGEAGATTNATFISSMCRQVRVTIGGTKVVQMSDTTDCLSNTDVGNRRQSPNTVTLNCGWQTISVVCANDYDSNCGPWNPKTMNSLWADNFGIGVDWLARGSTNATDYAKLVDPGDGSFLRRAPEGKTATVYGWMRPSFGGPVAFAAGTTLDLGDADGAAPLAIPSLEGLPAVTNGVLSVAGATWTLSAADIAAGGVLEIADGATVTFPSEVTIDITDVATLRRAWRTKRGTILSAATATAYPSATTFVLSDAAKAAHWRLERVDNELQLVHEIGSVLIVR